MAVNPLVKRPAERRRYWINFGNQPEVRDQGEALSAPAITVSPNGTGGLVVSNVAVEGDRVAFDLAGGTDGLDYDIDCAVQTSGGSQLVECVTLLVRRK